MATVDVVAVEELDSSSFFGLFFGILDFFTVFWLLDGPFAADASVSSFSFKKKETKCERLLVHEGSSLQSIVSVCFSRLDNFWFQSNILFEYLLSIHSISVQTKNIHAQSKTITFTCLNKTCK